MGSEQAENIADDVGPLRPDVDGSDNAEGIAATDQRIAEAVHELRAPLIVIGGYADIAAGCAQDSDGASLRKALAEIERQTRACLHLVDQLLDESRVAQSASIERTLDLAAECRAARERFRLRADLEHAEVAVSAPAAPVMVTGRPELVAVVLDNLLANAVLYSRGSAVIKLEVTDEPAILVSDHGQGIPDDFHERIFERFSRVHDQTPRPGSGLGLHLARRAAEEMGATLTVRSSQMDVGTTFALAFPSGA